MRYNPVQISYCTYWLAISLEMVETMSSATYKQLADKRSWVKFWFYLVVGRALIHAAHWRRAYKQLAYLKMLVRLLLATRHQRYPQRRMR